MMEETRSALQEASKKLVMERPKIIAVTVLTSLDDSELQRLGLNVTAADWTRKLTLLTKEAGLGRCRSLRSRHRDNPVALRKGIHHRHPGGTHRPGHGQCQGRSEKDHHAGRGGPERSNLYRAGQNGPYVKEPERDAETDRRGDRTCCSWTTRIVFSRPYASTLEEAKRIWIEAGYERAADAVIQEARKLGISFRVVSREEFARRFRGNRSHICLEREAFSYREPDSPVKGDRLHAKPFSWRL